MADRAHSRSHPIRPGEGDCWNEIGVRGDQSCPELATHVHCRNCPVYAAAAARLLDRPPPDGYLEASTAHFSVAKAVEEADTHSVVIFRIALEWLSLPTAVFKEITTMRPIHSLPHRRGGAVLGIGNVRGELLICVSLEQILGVEPAAAAAARSDKAHRAHERLLVIGSDTRRVACPVDEVHGIHRFHRRELKEVPATVARATAAHTSAMLRWRDHAVGCLDDERLFQTVNRSLT